jgi:hypothetical protein
LFAVFISLFALFNLVIRFLLALAKKTAGILSATVALTQIGLILIRHPSIDQVIFNSIAVLTIGLVIGMIVVVKILYGQEKITLRHRSSRE